MAHRLSAVLAANVVLALVAPLEAHAADSYSGQDVQALARVATDVMRAHQWLLAAQMQRDDVPIFADGIYRGMRAQLRAPDESTSRGLLTRVGVENWVGNGKVRTGSGWFGGVQIDGILADHDSGGSTALVGDGLLFAGAGYHGLSASVGLRFGWLRGFRPDGSFAGGVDTTTRPGTPAALADKGGSAGDRFSVTGFTFSTYHAEGVTLGATVDEAVQEATDGTISRKTVLAAARGLFQPAELVTRAGVRDVLGIPGIGLDRLAGEIDYYGDQYVALRNQLASARTAPIVPSPTAAIYEIPTSLDDLLSLGIRVKAVTQVAPTPLLRSAEVGWIWSNDTFQAGGRGTVLRRGDSYGGAYDVFGGVSLGSFMIVGSLSYNSPDASTSLPVPFARVIGLQLYFGPPEMARPIVPVVGTRQRPKGTSDGASTDDGGGA